MDKAISTFGSQTWLIFMRTVLYEERPRDVAMDLGLSATAVRQARFRVVSFLRKELGAFNKG